MNAPVDVAWTVMDVLRERFEAGDKNAVMRCLNYCLRHKPPLKPQPWAADAFVEITQRVYECEVGSWDEAFGRPYPKGTRLEHQKGLNEIRKKCFRGVSEAMANGETQTDACAIVGDKLGMSWQRVRQHYIRAKEVSKSVFGYDPTEIIIK